MNLANAFAANRDLHGALRESQEATRLAPNDSETHSHAGRILDFFRSGSRRNQRISSARSNLSLQRPKNCTTISGLCSYKKSDPRSAAAEFSEALRLQPNLCTSTFSSRRLALPGKILEEAAQHLQTAVQLNSARTRRVTIIFRKSKEQERTDAADPRAASLCCIEAGLP